MKMKLTFGEKLRNLREEKELNQTELGKRLGITQRKLSYLECGRCEPSIADIKAICMFFDVSADYLLGLPDGLNYMKQPRFDRRCTVKLGLFDAVVDTL